MTGKENIAQKKAGGLIQSSRRLDQRARRIVSKAISLGQGT